MCEFETDLMKEGESTSCLPLLDGTNYGYWKFRMHVYIKSLDIKVWISILIGWSPPTKIDNDGKTMVKTKSKWTSEEDKSTTCNWIALKAIQSGVDFRLIRLIAIVESTKEV